MITIIVAYCKENRVIGKNGKIPWNIPEDRKWFRSVTYNHDIVMGYNTWASIGRKLKGRHSHVLTHNFYSVYPFPADIWSSLEAFLEHNTDENLYVVGGQQIYQQFLDRGLVDKILASEVKITYEGDTYFPTINEDEWHKTIVKDYPEFTVVQYNKRASL